MEPSCRKIGRSITAGLTVFVWMGTAASALADGATRDLPDEYMPGVMLTVSIEIVAPPDVTAVGLQDVPPPGWTDVINISDGGIYDSDNQTVKWPPFFDNFSRVVTYDVTPPVTAVGLACFDGYVSIDGDEQPTTGDDCVSSSVTVPTLSGLGLVVMGLLVVAAAAFVLRGAAQGKQRCT
jgi:hypothetical protein